MRKMEANMETQKLERVIRAEVTVEAGVNEVWEAWTTEAGIKTFLAPAGNVELRAGGPYEVFFNPEAEPGQKGGEGNRVLAFQPRRMLSFTWNAPPSLPTVRPQRTHVVVRLKELAPDQTQVTLTHDGWGEGGEWDQALAYFSRVWGEVVLPRLQYRFATGPVDWENPPRF
jgi:uncharacterized protein YndB with AHSA1/START domain